MGRAKQAKVTLSFGYDLVTTLLLRCNIILAFRLSLHAPMTKLTNTLEPVWACSLLSSLAAVDAAGLLRYLGPLLAPLMAALAVLLSGDGAFLLPIYTDTFMGALGNYVAVLPALLRCALRSVDGRFRRRAVHFQRSSGWHASRGADGRHGLRRSDLWRRLAVRRGLCHLPDQP